MKYLVAEPDEALEPGLRADLLDTWIAVTDAGGAVGVRLGVRVHQRSLGECGIDRFAIDRCHDAPPVTCWRIEL